MNSLRILFCFLLFSSYGMLAAQANFTEKSDPNAKKILDAMKKDYDGQKSIEVNFDLTIELPNQEKEIQKGKLIQEGKKYMVKLDDQEIYSDGKELWLYLKSQNEVQINNIEEGQSTAVLSPKDIMRLYETGDYFYAITGESKENGVIVTEIEFKPLDKKSEYSKLRLNVNKKTNKASSLKVFSKDGSRFTLSIKDYNTNKNYPKSTFTFDQQSHKGVHIEDLRID